MNLRILTFLFGAFLAASSAVAKEIVNFEYGKRPPRAVFDPDDILDPHLESQVSDSLEKIFKTQGVDVIVVVLSDIGDAPPEHVANRFAAAWCKGVVHGVVLHVKGRADSPWIVPAGELINCVKPEFLQQQSAEAMRRASLEPKESGKILAAVTEASDMLRYWTSNALIRSKQIDFQRAKIRQDLETKAQRWRITALTSVASLVTLLLAASAFFFLMRGRGPRRFPQHTPVRRLGAPYAGGNHAVVVLGPPDAPAKPAESS
jgi:hypothetical protein